MLDKSIEEIHEALKNKKIKPIDLVEEAFDRIEKNKNLNAYITLNKEAALQRAKELEKKEVGDNLLFGLPIAVKDNIITKELRTTCASHILDNFIPIYNATVVEKINQNDMIIIGKTNMDEFAMGSSSRTSYFGAPKNPWNNNKISGGSSGGSATTISARDVLFALGTDTGGSIRQPASYTGIVGMKPTYGRVSRYGLVAFASSLDQIGPMTRNVYENALLLNVIAGVDEKDLTSADKEVEDFTRKIGKDIKGMKIALPKYFMSDIVTEEIRNEVEKTKKMLENSGATVDIVDMKYLDKAVTYDAVGCTKCNHSGYAGRIACFEILNLDEETKELIMNGASSIEIRKCALKGTYRPLLVDGINKVVKGITTLDELNRKLRVF